MLSDRSKMILSMLFAAFAVGLILGLGTDGALPSIPPDMFYGLCFFVIMFIHEVYWGIRYGATVKQRGITEPYDYNRDICGPAQSDSPQLLGQHLQHPISTHSNSSALSCGEYTIGWICALPIELKAAQIMLDQIHDRLPVGMHDSNNYTLGRIGSHNIVIACLPKGVRGPAAAASVATQMHSNFPSIKFCLMVGIGGGIPNQVDIRLGDVVVGCPMRDLGGVVQYDHGKLIAGGKFEKGLPLNKPPPALLNVIPRLMSKYMISGNTDSHPFPEGGAKYTHVSPPLASSDRLFLADYPHMSSKGRSCDDCDEKFLVNRVPRARATPWIHYGIIASGNNVIKDAKIRDHIAQDTDILCVETEAAGVMDILPCLVIRGISDYADSHKNDIWQEYAASMAAAYAKELLSYIASPGLISGLPHSTRPNATEGMARDTLTSYNHQNRPIEREHIMRMPEYCMVG